MATKESHHSQIPEAARCSFEYARVDAFAIAINKDVQALSNEFQ